MPFIKEDRFPHVLCGPMLRRVTADSVSAFVATREKADVTLVVSEEAGAEVARATGPTLQLGPRLHVSVLEARPAQPLRAGRTYTYNLSFAWGEAGQSRRVDDLGSLGLLKGPRALGYFEGGLPSLAIPPGLDRLKILHGSCRKPDGQGLDMLAVADALVNDSRPRLTAYPDPSERPHQLLLTGDQIYADDVFVPLARAVREVAMHLCIPRAADGAWELDASEMLPLIGGAAGVRVDDARVELGEQRRYFVNEQTGFSNYKAHGHLLFMAEFYAMYLLVWSDALWPREEDGSFSLLSEPSSSGGFCAREREEMPGEALREQFVATLPCVRRALANVPTLMLFDDHEVTDDWNLTRAWRDRVMSRPAGRQVVRNALVAYAIFQHWGNRPEDFRPGGNGWHVLQAASWQDGNAPALLTQPQLLDSVFGFDTVTPLVFPPPERLRWDYVIPSQEHQILALDTRTWRGFPDDPNNPYAPPELISAAALEMQFEGRITRYTPDPGSPPGKLTVVISGAPVLGLPPIETGQSFATTAGGGPEGTDNEAWVANCVGFRRVLRALSEFGVVVVVSGDVHYSFTNHADLYERHGGAERRSRVIQCCASALKNGSPMLTRLLLTSPPLFSLEGLLKPADALYRTMQDRLSELAARPEHADDEELQQSIQRSLLSLRLREKTPQQLLLRYDVLTNNPLFRDLQELFAEPAADERYRVHFLRDDREERGLVLSGWGGVSFAGDREVDARASRAVVPFSNLGRLTFEPKGGRMNAELLWPVYHIKDAPFEGFELEPASPLMSTKHVAPLTSPTPEEI